MKSAGKARSNGLYRHIRTSKEIIRNLLNDYTINNNVLEEVNKDAKYAVAFKMKDGKLDIYEVISLEDNLSEWYTEGTLLTTH